MKRRSQTPKHQVRSLLNKQNNKARDREWDKYIQRTERRPVQRKAMGKESEREAGPGPGPQKESGFHSSSSASQNLCPKKIKWPHDLETIKF